MERERRLKKGTEFDTAYREGTVVSGPLVVIRHRGNDLGVTRWGFAVGKRLAKAAVERNHTRRRLREAARVLGVAPGHDIIVTARGGALRAPFGELSEALERGLRRAGLATRDLR